ncbi:ABC transporter permease [Burkholderia multivorans]|uniref:ABC transporter permease n=1 Tax=Burkholderia multivorans TaxID=87883 RepID=UPI0021BDF145|nr:ABC transporter permease [Burkholderia multivorans]MDN7970525.1 ABC transporter permease [Burkholderia multivorans]
MFIDSIRKSKLLWGMVIIPAILATAYFGVLAEDRYVSSTEVVVHKVSSESGGSGGAQMQGLAVLMGGVGITDSTSAETLYVREFVVSQDMLNILQEKLHWSQHYAGRFRDMWYYLPTNASKEVLLKYYQRMVKAQFDMTTGLLTIEVQSFDREFADKTLSVIISESDRFVNEISHRLAREKVNFAESELERARINYEAKREALLQFQGANNVLDARQSALARNDVITSLQAELTKESASLRSMRASLSEDSPQVRQQKIRIDAIQAQIVAENQKLIAKNSNNKMNVAASRFEGLELEAGIAEDSYKASVASLESARIEAARKLRSLVVVVNPNMPDEALFPRRLYSLFTTLVILLLVYGITLFVIATINDHRD